ncbi:MAG: B-box zinc finger protein [Candidatus Thorarchaeota archaeon]|nr:B-box zinc finger protein [Candidatus Thorarchaeota archaeon]
MDRSEVVTLCPVCGGKVQLTHDDKVNRCEYCGSPMLGPSQNRDCVNHPGRLAKGVCRVCGDLVCEECMEQRVGDYGGKLLTVVNCRKADCVSASSWAQPLNREYMRLTNMDWADRVDSVIFRLAGIGGLLFMVFELFFILAMVYVQFFTSWGMANIPRLFIPGDVIVTLGILGNLLSAVILQTALQTYVHDRQFGSGGILLASLVLEVAFLLFRGLAYGLLQYPDPRLPWFLLLSFLLATVLAFVGALGALAVGYKKRRQVRTARLRLGLAV